MELHENPKYFVLQSIEPRDSTFHRGFMLYFMFLHRDRCRSGAASSRAAPSPSSQKQIDRWTRHHHWQLRWRMILDPDLENVRRKWKSSPRRRFQNYLSCVPDLSRRTCFAGLFAATSRLPRNPAIIQHQDRIASSCNLGDFSQPRDVRARLLVPHISH